MINTIAGSISQNEGNGDTKMEFITDPSVVICEHFFKGRIAHESSTLLSWTLSPHPVVTTVSVVNGC